MSTSIPLGVQEKGKKLGGTSAPPRVLKGPKYAWSNRVHKWVYVENVDASWYCYSVWIALSSPQFFVLDGCWGTSNKKCIAPLPNQIYKAKFLVENFQAQKGFENMRGNCLFSKCIFVLIVLNCWTDGICSVFHVVFFCVLWCPIAQLSILITWYVGVIILSCRQSQLYKGGFDS